ncbi:hypothetical protein ACP4OV_027199 [Aristida adscensionis]
MEVVTGAMGTLLPKLGNLLKEEYQLQKCVRDEVVFLKAELESMEPALLKVSEAPIDQPPDVQIRDNIGADIKNIKMRVEEVSERRDRCKIDQIAAKPVGITIESLCLSALYRKPTELFGAKEKSDDLVKMLMQGDEASKQQLRIVSIVGLGGLGKRTLAKAVYRRLKEGFDCGVFVSASQNPNMKNIFKNMLYELERYIIVVDDNGEKSAWETIKYAFVENEYGNKIIITSRILDVAKQAGDVYQLKPLSPAD